MKLLKVSEFRELRRVLAGYLHEDFLEDYETAAKALRAFRDDATVDERSRLSREVRRFLEQTESLNFDDVRTLLARLGARWTPPSREALTEALNAAMGDDDDPARS